MLKTLAILFTTINLAGTAAHAQDDPAPQKHAAWGGDIAAGYRLAAERAVPLVLYLVPASCDECHVHASNTLDAPELAVLRDRAVLVVGDPEHDTVARKAAAELGIAKFPTVVVIRATIGGTMVETARVVGWYPGSLWAARVAAIVLPASLLERALSRSRRDPPAWLWLVRALSRIERRDFTGALADLDAALARDPSLAGAWASRAWVLDYAGRKAEARRDIARAIAQDARFADIFPALRDQPETGDVR